MVSVKIDNVTVNIESGIEFLRDGTEEFNFGVMIIKNSTRKEPYPDFADVVLTINSVEYETTIQKDISNRTTIGIYEHTITLAEPIIKLSLYTHPDRKYTTISGSLPTYLYQLENLLDTMSLSETNPFTIHADTQTLLGITAVEKEYTGGDLLTTLTDMFRGVNAVPTLSLDNVIGHELFSELGTLITIGDVIGETITSDIGDYGLAVHSKIKKGTFNANITTGGTFFPASGYGVTPRSIDDKYHDDDAVWILDSGIRRILAPRIMNLDSQTLGITQPFIATWVVSKAEWDDLLTETTRATLTAGKYKNNTLYYVEDDNIIKNAGVKTKNNISPISGDSAMESLIRSYWVATRGTDSQYKAQNISDLEIEWYYQPSRDMDARVERHNIDRVTKNATVINNQKDSILELQRYGQTLKSHINRIGNDSFEITIRYTSYASFDLWGLNDYTSEGYKVVKIKLLARNNSVDATYLFTKNQSILDPLTAVNRKVSPFTISKRNVLTCYTYNEYVEFSDTQKSVTSSLTLDGLKTLLNALEWDATKDLPIYNAQYKLDGGSGDNLNMSVLAVPLGQSLTFNAQFKEPRIAGYQLTADGWLGHKMVPIPYADINGEVYRAFVSWGNGDVVVPDNHPVGAVDSTICMRTNRVTLGLNPDEIFGITHHQHIITDRSNLIVGDFFTENNSMVKLLALEQNVTLVYFDGAVKHTIYDKVANSAALGGVSYALNAGYDTITLTDVPSGSSWAIVESISPFRIYLAYNYDGTDLNTIYINRLKYRPNIEVL